jgi:DNA polymerase-3 subunit epsilon
MREAKTSHCPGHLEGEAHFSTRLHSYGSAIFLAIIEGRNVVNFIALDVETANSDLSSICSIGLVSFKDGAPIKSLSYLVDPQDEFDSMNIAIHGITPEDVVGKPTMRDLFSVIVNELQGIVIVHHTPFDRVAFKRCAEKYGFDEPGFSWLDTAKVARRAWDRYARSGYALSNLAKELEIPFQHHQAAEDARASGLILVRAIADSGLNLAQWVERSQQPLSGKNNIRALAGNPDGVLAGEMIVFTGTLEIPRHEAAKLAADAGCDVRNTVTRTTTILVVGDQDVRRFGGNEKSSKHRKAEEMVRGGALLRIISETDFVRLVSL